MVLGATNRPNDIDSAILRRMPKRFAVDLPSLDQRLKILTLVCQVVQPFSRNAAYSPAQILKDTKLCDGFPMVTLAERTEGLSGSDLKELCRNAAMLPMREMLRDAGDDTEELARLHKEVGDARI